MREHARSDPPGSEPPDTPSREEHERKLSDDRRSASLREEEEDRDISRTKHHVDAVVNTVNSNSAAARSGLAASWRRSMEHHQLDPSRSEAARRLGEAELAECVGRLNRFMAVAAPKLDQLFGLVGNSGCGVLLTDECGIVLDQRCSDADATVFESWGLSLGADWSEASEGTNGIGTCLAERRQVTIHRDEHFLARNIVSANFSPLWICSD